MCKMCKNSSIQYMNPKINHKISKNFHDKNITVGDNRGHYAKVKKILPVSTVKLKLFVKCKIQMYNCVKLCPIYRKILLKYSKN